MKKATKRNLVGRTIVDVNFQPFRDGKGGTAHAPVITLDNGRRIWFNTEETDVGDYGTRICISDKSGKGAPQK